MVDILGRSEDTAEPLWRAQRLPKRRRRKKIDQKFFRLEVLPFRLRTPHQSVEANSSLGAHTPFASTFFVVLWSLRLNGPFEAVFDQLGR